VINETTVNNYGDAGAGAGGDPWSGGGTSDPGSWDQSGQAAGGGDAWSGGGDAGGDTGADPGGDFGGGGDAGWDDSGGSDSSF
jgi:hypothetical protein